MQILYKDKIEWFSSLFLVRFSVYHMNYAMLITDFEIAFEIMLARPYVINLMFLFFADIK